jgi:uncharacterized protein YoxC
MLVAILILVIFLILLVVEGLRGLNVRIATLEVDIEGVKNQTDKLGTYGYKSDPTP